MAYYQTKIQSIDAGSAIDVQGKNLRFIGNLPCKAGDTVWTDGKIIFGNISRKAPSAPLDQPPKGIPIVADKIFIDGDFETCGYFKKNGTFKTKAIAEDDWTTNSDRIFEHGTEKISGQKVIKAEIGEKGELFTATEGFYRKSASATYFDWRYAISAFPYDTESNNFSHKSQIIDSIMFWYGGEVTLGVDSGGDEDTAIIFYRDGEQIDSLGLKYFADLAEEEALKIKDKILAKSQKDDEAINWTAQTVPPDDFVATTYANVATLTLLPDGDWEAVIVAASYGYFFPFKTFSGSIFPCTFDKEYNYTEGAIGDIIMDVDALYRGNLSSGKFPDGLWEPTNARQGFYSVQSAENLSTSTEWVSWREFFNLDVAPPSNLAEDGVASGLIDFYTEKFKFKYYRWFPMMFNAVKIFKVHNGEVAETIYANSGGGHQDSSPSWDEKNWAVEYFDDFIVEGDKEEHE